jgi:hypothetical protein
VPEMDAISAGVVAAGGGGALAWSAASYARV